VGEHDDQGSRSASRCDVCGRAPTTTERDWRTYLGVNQEDQVELILYCPDCLDELLVDDW
jgi:hypothetical protein